MAREFYWSIELMVDCPECNHDFDANCVDDFAEELRGAQICEAVKDCEVQCPKCKQEFIFDIGMGT